VRARSGAIVVGALVLAFVGLAVAAYLALRPKPASLSVVLTDNGYVELRPPSNLFLPGTWVEVLNQDPLRLSIICGPQDALGLTDPTKLASSASEAVSVESKLAPKFTLDANTLHSLQAKGDLSALRSVTFTLSNVKLLEIPDTAVVSGFKSRSAECRTAIGLRTKDPSHPVSMVKSALIADVEYVVDFEGSTGADARAKAITDLALDLGAKVDDADTSKSRLTGQGLVWGIRDDATLATFGYGLPPTGGPARQRSILFGHGPVTDADTRSMARRTFPDKQAFVTYDVKPLKQSTSMGCWATVFTMLKSWKDKRGWSVGEAVSSLGTPYVDRYVRDLGLVGGGERDFVRDANMVAEPPADYMLGGYLDMLKKDGPLWITLGDGLNSHALLLVGVYGTSAQETTAAYNTAVFEFIDPMTGSYTYRPADEFMSEFEREAAIVVNDATDDIDLRWQIIHWPPVSA
jgi:hypothetical protein